MRRTLPKTEALSVVLFSVALVVPAPAAVASGAQGRSTPGATVTAVNPAGASGGGALRVALNAHSEGSDVENASCRPQDSTLDCWGALVLRIPDAGGLSVRKFEVHRIAVDEVSCGEGGDDGSCGDDHDDGCGGDDGGCGGHDASTAATRGVGQPVQAVVNGVAELRDPGSTGLPAGAKVQVKILLTDNGDTLDADQIDVQINEFVPGSSKPELYRSGPQTIRQVRIHLKRHP